MKTIITAIIVGITCLVIGAMTTIYTLQVVDTEQGHDVIAYGQVWSYDD